MRIIWIHIHFFPYRGNFCKKINESYVTAMMASKQNLDIRDKKQGLFFLGKDIKEKKTSSGVLKLNNLQDLLDASLKNQDLSFSFEKQIIWQVIDNRIKIFSFHYINTEMKIFTKKIMSKTKISDDGTWILGKECGNYFLFHKEKKHNPVLNTGKILINKNLNVGSFKVMDLYDNFQFYNEEILINLFQTIKNFSLVYPDQPFVFLQGRIEDFQSFTISCIENFSENNFLKDYLGF